mgnify:CR=1 FL=1
MDGQTVANNRKFLCFIDERITDNDDYYLLLDKIQILDGFVRVLNGFLNEGFLRISLLDFLMNQDSLDW